MDECLLFSPLFYDLISSGIFVSKVNILIPGGTRFPENEHKGVFKVMGQRHAGCSCFDLLEDIGTAVGTSIIVHTVSGQPDFRGTIREAVTPSSEVLKMELNNGDLANICCDHIVAIQEGPGA
jgi:hypothetical protein